VIEIDAEYGSLTLYGVLHKVEVTPVDDSDQWVGMIEMQSPSNNALLTPVDARALRDWLDQRLQDHDKRWA
jgi:hypothetical protein